MYQLNVVYLNHCARLSGGELALARLLPSLDGIRATVILGEDGPLVPVLASSGADVRVRKMGNRVLSTSRNSVRVGLPAATAALSVSSYSLSVAIELRRIKPDLVVTNSLKSAIYGGIAGRLAGIPVVWHLRDRIAADYLPNLAVKGLRAAARVLPAGIIANSQTTLDTLRLPTRSNRQPRSWVINDPCPLVTDAKTRSLDRPAGGLVVGMVGRLAPWKGQDLFLRAFARAFPQGHETAVIVGGPLFGEEAYAKYLHILAERLNLRHRISFTGHVDDPWTEMASFDVLVHASLIPEPFGQVIVEGMALGLPVIASGAGGPTEIIRHGVDGLLCPPADEKALAETLANVGKDRELRHELGGAAAAAVKRFSPAVIAAEEKAAYELIARHPSELASTRGDTFRSAGKVDR